MFKFVFAALSLVAATNAQVNRSSCSNEIIIGTYAVSCSGFVTPGPNAAAIPMTILGTVHSDSGGLFTGTANNSVGGNVSTQSVVGQADTQSDCTGSIIYNKGQRDELSVKYVVTFNGDEILGMVVNAGANVSCTLKRIRY